MKFIDNNFRKCIGKNGTLYAKGYTNISDLKILQSIEANQFPKISGQFAFVYISNQGSWTAAVDHFCTTNLFYTNDMISTNFYKLSKHTNKTVNTFIQDQLDILQNHTVGDQTIYKEINRIEPEHYVENGKQKRYSDILNNPLVEVSPEQIYSRFIDVLRKKDLHKPTLLFTGGKDSGWLSLLLRDQNIRHRLIHITSKNKEHTVDQNAINDYKKELGYVIKEFEVDYSGYQENEKHFNIFWKNDTFPIKRRSVLKYPGIKLSGEIGAGVQQKMGFGSYLANLQAQVDIESIINIYIHTQHTHAKRNWSKPIVKEYLREYATNEAYDYIFEYFRNKINSIDKDPSLKYYNFMLQDHHSHRLFHESQDNANDWFCVYADYEIQNYFINSEWNAKHKDNISKYNLYNIGKTCFREWSDISWRYPTEGLGIPSKDKFRNV